MSMNKKSRIHLLDSTNGRSTWMTTKHRLNGARRLEGSHESCGWRSTSQHEFCGMTGIHSTIVTSSQGWNSPEPMVAEWEAGVTKFTELTPHLHYGTCSLRKTSHRATLHSKPWTIVVISTIETFYQRFNNEEADSSKFWDPGLFHQFILDEAHRLRMSGTPISRFGKANGKLVKMDSHDYNMHKASCILSLDPQSKWMLTATPLVNGIADLYWILRFLESSSWLTLQLLPNTFDYTLSVSEDWVVDGSNVSGTEHDAGFTPVADSYMNGPE